MPRRATTARSLLLALVALLGVWSVTAAPGGAFAALDALAAGIAGEDEAGDSGSSTRDGVTGGSSIAASEGSKMSAPFADASRVGTASSDAARLVGRSGTVGALSATTPTVASSATAAAVAAAPATASSSSSSSAGSVHEVEVDDTPPAAVKQAASFRHNFAAHTAGAQIMAHNPEMTHTSALLRPDSDAYALSRCDVKKWVVLSLSEEVIVDTLIITNEEKYSSSIEHFRVVGSLHYPANEWIVLGNFTAERRLGQQSFNISVNSFVKYLRISWLSHYGSEFYCTWTHILVHGSTVLEDMRADMLLHDQPDAATTAGMSLTGANRAASHTASSLLNSDALQGGAEEATAHPANVHPLSSTGPVANASHLDSQPSSSMCDGVDCAVTQGSHTGCAAASALVCSASVVNGTAPATSLPVNGSTLHALVDVSHSTQTNESVASFTLKSTEDGARVTVVDGKCSRNASAAAAVGNASVEQDTPLAATGAEEEFTTPLACTDARAAGNAHSCMEAITETAACTELDGVGVPCTPVVGSHTASASPTRDTIQATPVLATSAVPLPTSSASSTASVTATRSETSVRNNGARAGDSRAVDTSAHSPSPSTMNSEATAHAREAASTCCVPACRPRRWSVPPYWSLDVAQLMSTCAHDGPHCTAVQHLASSSSATQCSASNAPRASFLDDTNSSTRDSAEVSACVRCTQNQSLAKDAPPVARNAHVQDASEGSTHPQDASVQVSPSVLEATPAEGVKTEEGAAPSSELAATGEEDSSAAASELSVHGGVQLSQGMQASQGVQPADVLSLLETWHSRILESRSNSAAMTAHVASSNVLKVLARRVKDLQSEQVLTSTFLVQALSALLDVHAQTSARVQQLEAQVASLAQAVQASSTPTPRATQVAALEQANADLSRRVATLEAALQHLVPATSPRYSTLIQEHVSHAWAAAQHWRTRAWSTLRTLELPAWATRLLPSPHPSLGVSAHAAPSQSAHASSAPPPHVQPTPHASPSADAPLQATQETAVEAVVPRVVVEVSPPQAAHTPAVSQAIKPAVLSSAHGTVLADALWHQRMSVASLIAVITLALALAAYRKWVAGDRRARLARGTVFDSKTGDVSSTCCCNRRRPAVPTGGEYLVPVPPFPPYAADQPLRSPFLTPEITPRRSRRSRSPADSPVSPSFFSSSPT